LIVLYKVEFMKIIPFTESYQQIYVLILQFKVECIRRICTECDVYLFCIKQIPQKTLDDLTVPIKKILWIVFAFSKTYIYI